MGRGLFTLGVGGKGLGWGRRVGVVGILFHQVPIPSIDGMLPLYGSLVRGQVNR